MAPPIARLEPSFILAGVPRAGTTALWDALVQNDPNIVAPTTKELNYFNSVGWELKPARWYLSQFPRRTPSRNRITGDGSCTWRATHVKTVASSCLFDARRGFVDECKKQDRSPYTQPTKILQAAFDDLKAGGCPAIPEPPGSARAA